MSDAEFGAARHTRVAIEDRAFLINGRPTYEGVTFRGHDIGGRLFNSRMIQALFDDENPETRDGWAYPDTGEYDADRNTAEFLAALPTYYERGLRAVTVNLQCGSPEGYSDEQPWIVSAYEPDGSLKPAWTHRLRRVLDRADDLGMVVILGLFYFGQDGRLADEAAVERAVDNALEWLLDREYTNVVIEVNNECDIRYDHAILDAERVPELIERIHPRERAGFRYPVGTSFSGGTVPTDDVIDASDVVLVHGNGVEDPDRIGELVAETRERPAYDGEPIVFNEDDHFRFGSESNLSAAIEAGVSWGYFDPGENNYRDGYQSPPVQWRPNTARKKAFFGYLDGLTSGER
jgi:hypothetical protein